ncbi:hypothetical protein H311_04265, partial [Anncaliia algerae PRA109]
REDEKVEEVAARLEKCKLVEHLEYAYEPGNTKVSLKKKIPYLENVKIQDIREWITNVSEDIKQAKWSDEDSVEILNALIRIPYVRKKEKYLSPAEIFSDLYDHYFPKEDSYIYLENLKNIKQNSFNWIGEYVEAINRQVIKISIALKLSKREIQNRFEEAFITGLCVETRIEMINLKYYDNIHMMIDHIKEVEKVIKENVLTDKHNITNNVEEIKNSNYDWKNKPKKPIKSKQWFEKWCKICKSSTHNTKESFKLNKDKLYVKGYSKSDDSKNNKIAGKNDPKDKTRSYILKNNYRTVGLLRINSYINEKPYEAIFDCGSEYNFINESIVGECKLKREPIKEFALTYGNGETSVINTKVNV